MPATVWTVNGKTLEELRCSSLAITFHNRAADEARLLIDGDLSDAAGFAYGQTYAVARGSATVFRGRCEKINCSGTGTSQSCEITLLGGWHWLTLRMYQQSWPKGADGRGNKSRVILGCDDSGNLLSANSQIADIVNCCPEVSSAAIGISSSTFPMDERVDITCAEALDAVLAWWPDAVAWFDYTSGSVLHLARASNLPVKTLSVLDAAEEVQATPRHDLVVPGVRLIYETTSGACRDTVEDTAGDPDALGGLIQTITVAGSDWNLASSKITSSRLPENLTPAWWASRIPELAGWEPTDPKDWPAPSVTLSDGTPVAPRHRPGGGTTWIPELSGKNLHSELLSGTIADWMHEVADRVRITQAASYTLNGQTVEDAVLSIDLVLTSAETGVYQRGSASRPETIPPGLAAEIYSAVGKLYHEGTVALVGEAPPASADGIPSLGDALLLPDVWTGTSSPVQSVAWDVATGTTRITFGPPNHLGVQDLVARCRANRLRGPARSHSARLSATTDEGDIGHTTGTLNTSSGGGRPSKITVGSFEGGVTKTEITPNSFTQREDGIDSDFGSIVSELASEHGHRILISKGPDVAAEIFSSPVAAGIRLQHGDGVIQLQSSQTDFGSRLRVELLGTGGQRAGMWVYGDVSCCELGSFSEDNNMRNGIEFSSDGEIRLKDSNGNFAVLDASTLKNILSSL